MFIRGKGDRSSLPADKFSNKDFSSLIFYWVKRDDLDTLDKKTSASRHMFLRKSGRYTKMQANLEDGSSKSEDVWEELATYLNLTGEERARGRELEILLEYDKEEITEARDTSALEPIYLWQ